MMEIVNGLLTGEYFGYQGEIFQLDPIKLCPAPSKPVPMWTGGMNKAALRRAGQFCDGWTGAGGTFEETVALLEEIRVQRERFGRLDRPFDCLVPLTQELEPGQLEELIGLGMTATVSWPLEYQLPPNAQMQDKKDKLRQLGEEMIMPVNG